MTSFSRVWLFRGLAAIAAGLMAVSWFLPWWSCDVLPENGWDVIRIYPYGLYHNLGFEGSMFMRGAEMPAWFAPFAFTYLAASIGLILYSLFLKGRKGKMLIGGTGLAYILVAVIAVIFAAIRTGDYGLPLLEKTVFSEEPYIEAMGSLQFGYWLAHGVGLFCVALALLRDKIIGKAKTSA